ncbi:MAG: undecaprenyl/decaprenyl-phosphate alpha-N-acetylglucosaminyl 1-phosphate transferase [Calditrichaeota bacterium]|nr:undecaprenyl/decaprenyl-phosphate alpha-N-acetylglucosaminyl 1-phosphate transferase [Calditrichota bacterium]
MKTVLLTATVLFSTLVSLALVPFVRRLALARGIYDLPGERKIHQEPVPLLGGVAIWGSFVATVGLGLAGLWLLGKFPRVVELFPSYPDWTSRLPGVAPKLLALLGGATLVALLGLADDVRKGRLDYRTKFPVQFAVATAVVLTGVRTQFLPGQVLDVVFSILWIVGITNAFNLLDNMDGLTAGVAVISGLAFLVVTATLSQDYMAFLLASLVGASLGFLRYNFYPAKIFMGDTGSLTLGFLFGATTILASYIGPNSPTVAPVVMPLLVLSVPIFDTLSVMAIRWREGRPLFVGDQSHFSHRLVALGMTERQAVTFIYLVNVGVASGAVLLPYLTWAGCAVMVGQAIILYTLLTILLRVSKMKTGQ